jgi:hypothetical protein
MRPGQEFTKIWRLQNAGACTWTEGYLVGLFSGSAMGAGESLSLGKTVLPGGSVEIVVDLVAPLRAGKYQGNWKLRSTNGKWFGIGPNGGAPFWVRIEVVAPPTSSTSATPVVEPELTETPAPTDTLAPEPTFTPTPLVTATLTVTLLLKTPTPGAISRANDLWAWLPANVVQAEIGVARAPEVNQ